MTVDVFKDEELKRAAWEVSMHAYAGSAKDANAKRTWRESVLYWMGIPTKAERAKERAERERAGR